MKYTTMYNNYAMLFPIIRIRDKQDGDIHIVGKDPHDSLRVDKNGGISYYNYQWGEGTGKYGSFEFLGKSNEQDVCPQIEFVTFEELQKIYNAAIMERMERATGFEKIMNAVCGVKEGT